MVSNFPEHLAVTATRDGLTDEQAYIAMQLLDHALRLSHGAARGGDSQLHYLAHDRGVPCSIWPADNVPSNLSGLDIWDTDVIHPAGKALDRNHDIILDGHALAAFPRLMQEELRSGTWAAVRFARKTDRPILIVWPDGTLTRENRPSDVTLAAHPSHQCGV